MWGYIGFQAGNMKQKKPLDKDFVTSVYYKFDYCSHWHFYGQDYLDGDKDSYYHLCGIQSINNFQRTISFINRIFERLVIKRMTDERDEISDNIDNVLLEGYTIEEVDSKGLIVED